MFRRYFFPVVASLAFVFSTAILVSAQTGALRGHVVMKQADGTTVPAADAVIDVYRTDVTAKYATKTDKKGAFVFAGLPFIGTYIIAASKEGATPTWIPNVKVGREVDYELELTPGNGRRLTPDEVKTAIAQSKGPAAGGEVKESAEDKAKREEIEKQNAAIMASNKKAEESNAVVQRTFKAGNEAIKAKNYDEAIKQFAEGIAADPEHPGAPSLLTNQATALNSRAVASYNAAIQAKDDATKSAGLEAAKKDWRQAFEGSSKAVTMLKALPATPGDPNAASSAKSNLYFALLVRAEASRFYVTKVDAEKVDLGVTNFNEYIAAESDPVKKSKAEHDLAQMLFDANAFDKALAQYGKILDANPDDLEALLRSGQALFNVGALSNDKVKYQEAANFLARFVEKAPDTNPFKGDAKAILDTLKEQENVKPVGTPARRRRP
ncbi:MAG TPA: tetratricopeptide repeat protein [Pyrinomonadaceae bacterium]|nr:tetratricopeptide repeat protein [Pyrinomonadaceae bacterium]